MLVIIDYGLGNLSSVSNMVRHVGGAFRITSEPAIIEKADKIILPGVGAFDHGMAALQGSGIAEALSVAVVERMKPILGICLGMQLMCRLSEEGCRSGLGWLDAEVKRFRFSALSELKIPHMGWNTLKILKRNPLLSYDSGHHRFYFVHSYHVMCVNPEYVIATAHYGFEFCAAFQKNNIFGVQFHPEKSHKFGMALISRFLEL